LIAGLRKAGEFGHVAAQTEVSDLWHSIGREKDILWLHVAVNPTPFVEVANTLSELLDKAGCGGRVAELFSPRFEITAGKMLHNKVKILSGGRATDFEQCHDIAVPKLRFGDL